MSPSDCCGGSGTSPELPAHHGYQSLPRILLLSPSDRWREGTGTSPEPSLAMVTDLSPSTRCYRHVRRALFRCPQHLNRLSYWAREPGLPLEPLRQFPVEACPAWVAMTIANHSYRCHSPPTGEHKPHTTSRWVPRGGVLKH